MGLKVRLGQSHTAKITLSREGRGGQAFWLGCGSPGPSIAVSTCLCLCLNY